jgi:hypothetical protein
VSPEELSGILRDTSEKHKWVPSGSHFVFCGL